MLDVDVVGATVVDVVLDVDVVGATVVDVVLDVDVVEATVMDVVLVVDVVGATVVDVVLDVVAAVVATGSATGSGVVDPHANPMDASTATAVKVMSTRTLGTLLLRFSGKKLYGLGSAAESPQAG